MTGILKAMEYHVPQFIEVEDKIVGPLTLRQFIYLAGAMGLCIIFFMYLPTIAAFFLSAPAVGLGAALAFYRVNGKTFVQVLEAGFNYYTNARLFLWMRQESKKEDARPSVIAATEAEKAAQKRADQKLTRSKLSELAWSLDIKSTPK